MTEGIINYWAILVSAIASMVLGMIWYSPGVFGKEWMKLSGLTESKMAEAKKKGMGKLYFTATVGSLITSYVLGHVVYYTGAVTIADGIRTGLWVWLGFVATTLLGSVLWEGKPVKLYVLNNAYYLISFAIMASILATWR